jgi:cytosine permease
LGSVRLPRYNLAGLFAYAVGAVLAYASPWVAPLVGISASALCYILLIELRGRRQALGQAEVEP